MKADTLIGALLLAILAAYIWLHDLKWITEVSDTLPILVSHPLFYWMTKPWKWKKYREKTNNFSSITGAFLFALGSFFNLTLLLGAAWCCFFYSWIQVFIEKEHYPQFKKLMILPFMAFPWVIQDAEQIGWFFRLTGAGTVEAIFSFFSVNVIREGTLITVKNTLISVEPACSGLNTLQSMLIAGSVLCFMLLGNSSRYWWNLALIPLIAWSANTLRILSVSIAALTINPEFARGPFHDIGGMLILMIMFSLCWVLFSSQSDQFHTSPN